MADEGVRAVLDRPVAPELRASPRKAVARKLLIRLFIMLRDGIDYDEFRRRGRGTQAMLASAPAATSCPSGRRSSRAFPGWFMVLAADQLIGTPTIGDLESPVIAYEVMRRLREWMINGHCFAGTIRPDMTALIGTRSHG
jgi:hypothetical protein